LLEGLLTDQNIPANAEASLYELYFVFSAVWGFSGACDDQGGDFRAEFSQMWRSEWRNVMFRQQGTVFDYCVNHDTKKFILWPEVSEKFEYVSGRSTIDTLVFAPETSRIRFITKHLVESGHAVMLAGFAGTGKSVLVRHLLNSLNSTK